MSEQESYLIFGLRGGLYAIPLPLVQQIIRLKADYFNQKGLCRGEILYKGKTLPLVDLCFLFSEHHLLSIGEGIILTPPQACLIVENVLDVWEHCDPMQVLPEETQPLHYFLGTIRMNKNIVLVLNLPLLLQKIHKDAHYE
ncbi:MAG: chemotaxis protein CheW [Planctomycetota bacterium]